MTPLDEETTAADDPDAIVGSQMLRAAVDGLGVFDGLYEPDYLEQLRALDSRCASTPTAEASGAALASYDRRVRRAVGALAVELVG